MSKYKVDITGGVTVRWLQDLSLRTRTFLLIGIGLVIILGVFGFLSVSALQESTDRVFAERLRLAQLITLHIDDHVAEALASLERAAASEGFDLTDADPAPERHALRELHRTGFFTYDVFITDKDGVVRLVEPDLPGVVGADFSVHPHIRDALQTGQPQVSNLIIGVSVPKPLISFVAPVKNRAGEIVGLIGGAMDPMSESLARIIQPLKSGDPESYIQIVDTAGLVIAHSEGKRLLQPPEHVDVVLALMAGKKPGIVTREVSEEGTERFSEVIAFVPSRLAPWGVFVEQSEMEAFDLVHKLRQWLILAGAVFLLATLVLAWLTTQAVVVPIYELRAAARRVAAGDLSTPITVTGRDEVAELGHGFEAMRQKLAAWGEELETAVQKRTRELSVLYAIDRAAAQSLDLDEILNHSLDKVLEVLEMEAGGIYLLEPDGETMTLRVHRGVSDETVGNMQQIKLGEGVSGRAAAEKKPVVLDVAREAYPTERFAPHIIQEGLQTLASTPLLSAGELVGALTLATRRPRAFPPEELDLLTAIGRQLGGAAQNARLHEDTLRKATQLGLLYDAGLTINRELDPRVQLEFLCKIAMTAVHADRAGFFRCDAPGNQMRLQISIGYSEEIQKTLPGLSFPMGEAHGLVGWVAQNRLPFYLPDVSADPRWVTIDPEIRAALWVSVVHEKELLGVLVVFSTRVNAFSPHDERLLISFANQVAVAMVNARLYQAARKRLEEIAGLQKASMAVAGELQLPRALDRIVMEVASSLGLPFSAIFLLDETSHLLHIRAAYGLSERYFKEMEPVPPGFGLAGKAVAERQPVVSEDLTNEPRMQSLPHNLQVALEEGIRAILVVPMLAKGKIVGTLSVYAKMPHTFAPEEIHLLSTFADQAAIAVENARLYSETQQNLARIRNLYELSTEILATTTTEETARVVVQQVVRAADAHSAMLNLLEPDGRCTLSIGMDQQGLLPPEPPPRPDGTTMEIFRSGEPLIVTDVTERRAPVIPRLMEMGIQAFIGLPLKVGARVIGVLFVRFTESRAFSADETLREALTIFANQAATALEKARLYQGLEESKTALEAKVRDLERFTRLAVGRELRMKELKERVRKLEEGVRRET